MTKIPIYIILFFIIGSTTAYYLTNYTHPTEKEFKPEVMRLIDTSPEVIKFYQTFDKVSPIPYNYNKGLVHVNNTTDKFRIAFDAQHDGQIHYLGLFYFAWNQLGVTYQCYDHIQNYTRIYSDRDVLENMRYDC